MTCDDGRSNPGSTTRGLHQRTALVTARIFNAELVQVEAHSQRRKPVAVGDASPGEVRLPGGNVGGAVKVDDTVRRPVGPWTPAVHALLRHLDGRVPSVPRVLGFDDTGREVLEYLPGDVVDLATAPLSQARLESLVRWVRLLHTAVVGFNHPGPWRMWRIGQPTLVGHNDLGAYNMCWRGDDLVGVFDWDLAGPSNPLMELAFVAWNGVPMWAVHQAPEQYVRIASRRLGLVAEAYGGIDPLDLLHAVPARIQLMVEGIPRAAAAGDEGMANLVAAGHHARDVETLAALRRLVPDVERSLRRQ